MIHIQRALCPQTLISDKAIAARQQLEQQVQAGQVDLTFDPDIYGAADVKWALVVMQHSKCCFCESRVTHVAYGDVEHFRPKAAVLEDNGQLRRPGYYWLAYTWENLLFACEQCNRRHKRNKFPVERVRATKPSDVLDQERPLFIDPAGPDDPETLITFTERGRAVAVNGNRRGEMTIEALGLNRDALVEERQGRIVDLKSQLVIKRLAELYQNQDDLAFAEQNLRRYLDNDAEYAGLGRAFLKRYIYK